MEFNKNEKIKYINVDRQTMHFKLFKNTQDRNW